MEIEVNIDAAAVQRQVADAILASALGAEIEKAIQGTLKRSGFQGESVIEQAVKNAVFEETRAQCRRLVREPGPIHDMIEEKVQEALTSEKLDDIAALFVHKLGLVGMDDMASR